MMVIGVTGATGFVGRHFTRAAAAAGHEVVGFSRQRGTQVAGIRDLRPWNDGRPDVSGLDAVVNLAGESILGWWSRPKRRRIFDSRVEGTRRLVATLADASPRPATLVSASAIGYYGDRGETGLTESSAPGDGFLADVTRAWEDAAMAAQAHEVRVACLRIGLVLGTDGGAWPWLRRIFRAGLGGRLGSGRQWTSWIHVADVAAVLLAAATRPDWSGPVNAVSPAPVTNAALTAAVARALGRPALLPAPAPVLRAILRDQAALLLASQRVLPETALRRGFHFAFPSLETALADLTRVESTP